MDAIINEITRVVNLLDVLKSRFFFLRAKYDIGKVLTFLSINTVKSICV